MPDVFEAVTSVVKTFLDNDPKTALHVGEVMSCWSYLTVLEESIAANEVGLNTTTDGELTKALKEAIQMSKSQADKLAKFLRSEGVSLPERTEEKPKSNPASIPMGVKATDEQLANVLAIQTATATVACATAESQSLRNDLSVIWLKLQSEQVTFATTLRNMMRKRGWLKIPPYYHPPGLPVQ